MSTLTASAAGTVTHDAVRDYYGKVLASTQDLKTNACCPTDALPAHIRAVLSEIEDEIITKFYGCGSPLPLALAGATVLDLGCGTGRDAYVAAKLVGPKGRVIGVDMTEEQLAVAVRHRAAQMARFGYDAPNIDFRLGYIEDLAALGLEDDSVDVVISNCVINLSPDKRGVFSEIFRVLKPGGELYFADIFADRRLPASMAEDPVLLGECLGGAMYTEDLRRLLADLGCRDFRVVTSSPVTIENEDIQRRVGNARFTSQTIRAFKLPDLIEDRCEDYGQVAYYEGTIPESPHEFLLDDHHRFEAGRPMLVCGNTAAMVEATRYAPHFRVVGDRQTHYGLFDCAPAAEGRADAGCGC